MKTQVIRDITLRWLVNTCLRFDDRGAFIFRVKQPKVKGITHFRNVSRGVLISP
jgi:hypothetical protein